MRTKGIPDLLHHTASVHVQIGFPFETFHDKDGQRVLNIDSIYNRLGPWGCSTALTLENTSMYGTRIEDLWDGDNPIHGSIILMWLEVESVAYSVFAGIISGVSEWTRESITFECASYAALYDKPIGTVLGKETEHGDGYFPNLPDSNVGKIIPWVWGTVNGYKPVLVDDDQVTELTQAMISTDTTANVASTENFASTGTIQINDEKMTYTGTTSTTFTGLTRGASSTIASSHVKGNQVVEVGTLKYLVANHTVTSISNVRYITSDDIEVPVTPDTTSTGTTPSYIEFNAAPMADVPTNAHKLKFVDLDTDNSSTCTNPTYALGRHADWTEYNYATIDAIWEACRGQRAADVTPPVSGDAIRAWAVIEYWKDYTDATDTKVEYISNNLGSLPDDTNTPDDVKEDETIHTMSAGFEDDHTHELPDGSHAHYVTGATTARPVCNSPDDNEYPDYGTLTNAYNGNWDDYDEYVLSSVGVTQVSFYMWTNPESMGVNSDRTIERILVRAKYEQNPGSGVETCNFYFTITGSSTYQYDFISGGDMPLNGSAEIFSSGWVDVTSYGIDVQDAMNAKFIYNIASGSLYGAYIYNLEVMYQLDDGTGLSAGYIYEPVSTGPNGDNYDLDYTSYSTSTSTGNKWYWSSNAKPNSGINRVMICVTGGGSAGQFRLYMNGVNQGTLTCSTNTTNILDIDVSASSFTGATMTQGNTYIENVTTAASANTYEIGVWVQYDDSGGGGQTSTTDVGDTDEQQGNYSNLAWFDISSYVDLTDWQDVVAQQLSVARITSGTKTVKILRMFYAFEFAPTEKKVVKDLVCDVVARDGTFDNIIGDVLTDQDLMAIPSALVSVPTTTNAGAGALLDHRDGWGFIEQLLNEGRAHGYWSYSGIFTVRWRPARGSLGSADLHLEPKHGHMLRRNIRDFSDLVNKIEVFYNYDFHKQTMADSLISENATSQTKYNKTSEMNMDLEFVRSESEAQDIGDIALSYLEECFTEYDVEAGLVGFNIEPSDILSTTIENATTQKLEVKEVRLLGLSGDVLAVEVKGAKYD